MLGNDPDQRTSPIEAGATVEGLEKYYYEDDTPLARLLGRDPTSVKAVDGEDVFAMDTAEPISFRQRAAIVFQDPFSSLDPRMTAGEIVREPLDPSPRSPSPGCRLHTRCPHAREACRESVPEDVAVRPDQRAACFRAVEDHTYWRSEPIEHAGVADEEYPDGDTP